ncbi:hypothetical protein GCM10023323_13960 [Streptomyces thinghirensis]|uniref:Uncharacterized protein n=1 Tax=Streptomyces thinghirensis TaxID=551547 RepID=A0ABP9SX13_9ACTN
MSPNRAASRRFAKFPAPNLFPPPPAPDEECGNTSGQPPVTRPELGLYRKITSRDALFCQVRSHWGSQVTADTENNPLIGLPNQHIVGLTYVP